MTTKISARQLEAIEDTIMVYRQPNNLTASRLPEVMATQGATNKTIRLVVNDMPAGASREVLIETLQNVVKSTTVETPPPAPKPQDNGWTPGPIKV